MKDQDLLNWLSGKQKGATSGPEPLSQEEQAELARFDRLWENANPPATDLNVDADAAWNKLNDRLFGDEAKATSPLTVVPGGASVRNFSQHIMRIAAIGAFLLVAATAVYVALNNNDTSTELLAQTTAGQTEDLLLADGSRVVLNENSTLRFYEAGNERRVTLEGEAFFDVARDENKPFVITTGELETRVLGTSFNVRAYPAEPVEVAVATGSVQVSDDDEKVVLKPDELVTYAPTTKKLSATQANEVNAQAWAQKELSYENTQLRELLPALERFYGRKIVVTNAALLNCPLTARFLANDLEAAITLLEFQFGEIDVQPATLTFNGEGCN